MLVHAARLWWWVAVLSCVAGASCPVSSPSLGQDPSGKGELDLGDTIPCSHRRVGGLEVAGTGPRGLPSASGLQPSLQLVPGLQRGGSLSPLLVNPQCSAHSGPSLLPRLRC